MSSMCSNVINDTLCYSQNPENAVPNTQYRRPAFRRLPTLPPPKPASEAKRMNFAQSGAATSAPVPGSDLVVHEKGQSVGPCVYPGLILRKKWW